MACLITHSGSPFFHADARDNGGGAHVRTLIGIAVSLARQLGMHHLDSDANSESCALMSDTSFTWSGPSLAHTELGRRWWWSLVVLDAKSCDGKQHERHIPPGSCTYFDATKNAADFSMSPKSRRHFPRERLTSIFIDLRQM